MCPMHANFLGCQEKKDIIAIQKSSLAQQQYIESTEDVASAYNPRLLT